MASKRTTPEEGNDERDRQVTDKRRSSHSERPQTLYPASVGSHNSTKDMAFSLPEPVLRRMIQEMLPPIIEEVMPTILKRYFSPRSGLSLNRPPIGSALQLCFMNTLPSKTFTQTKITAEDGSPLQIALCEWVLQQRRVKEDAPSVRVKLCVLKGDFGTNGSEDFTAEDFKANILGPRERKPPLLCGEDTVVTLKNGVGYINNIFITDVSCWTKSGKFQIGLICESTSIGTDIMEGRSEPFKVLDKRGEAYEKHDPPSLNDEVWRLQKIAKNGQIRRQLSLMGIKSVKDMLRRCMTDEASLRQSIGNIPGKKWETIIEHAKRCEIDDHERYIFAADQSASLVFNCIYEVVEVSFNGQNFRSLESLNSEEERLVEKVKKHACRNLKDLKPFEPTAHSLMGTMAAMPWVAPDQYLPQFDHSIAQQDPFIYNLTGQQPQQQQTWPNSYQPSTSTTSNIDEEACSDQQQDYQLGGWSPYLGDNEWSQNATDLWGQLDFFCAPPYDDYGAESSKPVDTSTRGKAKAIWRKKFRNVGNALKWLAKLAVQRKTKVYHCQDWTTLVSC